MTSIGSFVNPTFLWAWEGARSLIKAVEPYQTRIATGMILSKLAWRRYKQTPLKRELDTLNERIARQNRIINDHGFAGDHPAVERLGDLIAERNEKKRQMSYTYLTFGQIPSLFFAHPGSNIYQSVHQLAVRSFLIRDEVRPVRKAPPTLWSRTKHGVSLLAGFVSLAGTAASLARMVGAVAQDNSTSHFLTMSAIAVHTIEGALITIATMKSTYAWAKEYFRQPNPEDAAGDLGGVEIRPSIKPSLRPRRPTVYRVYVEELGHRTQPRTDRRRDRLGHSQ